MRLTYFILVLFLAPVLTSGQSLSKLERNLFEKDMTKSISILNKKIKKGNSSYLPELAYSYNRMHKDKLAYDTYIKAHASKLIVKTEHIIDFVDLCKAFKADSNITNFYSDILNKRGLKNGLKQNSEFKSAKIQSLCFNTEADEFGFVSIPGFNFVSTTYYKQNKEVENSKVKTYMANTNCTFQSTSDAYFPVIDSKFHQGPIFVSKDLKYIFMTVSREKKNQSDIYNLQICYTMELSPGKYGPYQPLPFSSDSVSMQHPCFDETTNALYFSGNLPGGAGGFDIYRCPFQNGVWGKPEPIEEINTAANEAFPFVDKSGNLFYSSKMINGYGGMDLLCLAPNSKAPFLLDPPLNTPYDDFGLFMVNSYKGYFASNRPGGKGGDDVYSFSLDTTPYLVRIHVYDSLTQLPLAKVIATPTNFNSGNYSTSDSGMFPLQFPRTVLNKAIDLQFNLSLPSYLSSNIQVKHTFGLEKEIDLYYPLAIKPKEPEIPLLKVGDDLGKFLSLKPIYFNLDKSDITPKAAEELDKVVKAMKEYPTLVIELGSHTDSRASTQYNMKLSQRRAESSANYILSKGIDPSRLTRFGYGESRLINKCADNVKCTSEEHALNRRTEFIIIKM